MRIELGLSAADPGEGGAAIGRPEQTPEIVIRKIAGRRLKIVLRDEATKVRRPRGASGAVIFVQQAEQPSADLSSWRFMGIATRARKTLKFGTDFPPGAKVWIVAQWFSTRGEVGAASKPVYAYLQGAPVAAESLARVAA